MEEIQMSVSGHFRPVSKELNEILFFIKRKTAVLLYPFGHSCWLPLVGKQSNKFVISSILYPAEDIT